MLLCMGPCVYSQDEFSGKARCYIEAYPGFFTAYENGCLITRDRTKIPFDDGIPAKDYEKMVVDRRIGDRAFDPEDAFYWCYDAHKELPSAASPPEGDPGRIRPAEVFTYMYGRTASQRKAKMRHVKWIGDEHCENNTILVTTVNGVDKALEQIAQEIRALPEENRQLLEGTVIHAGAFSGYCERHVRDYPERTSAHSYGIAVDVNHDDSYFIGCHKDEPYAYRNNMPKSLVDIFELHGFIWGGRWHSYDIMHFEYRPELLLYTGKAADTGSR